MDSTNLIRRPDNAVQMKSRSDFQKGDRLYYEHGYYAGWSEQIGFYNWTRNGHYIEVQNPEKFVEQDDLLNNPEYIEHHNFILVKDESKEL